MLWVFLLEELGVFESFAVLLLVMLMLGEEEGGFVFLSRGVGDTEVFFDVGKSGGFVLV